MDDTAFKKTVLEEFAKIHATLERHDIRFKDIEAKLDTRADRAEMHEQFTKLFAYMEDRFDRMQAQLDKKADANRMYSALDAIAKRLGINEQEWAGLSSQVDRHEDWIKQLAGKASIQLSPKP